MNVVITYKCNKICKCCNNGLQFINQCGLQKHILKEDVILGFDIFTKNSTVRQFGIMGGELLLHPDIEYIMDSIGQKQSFNKELILTTNGIIILSDELLKICHKHRIKYHISVYPDVKEENRQLIIEKCNSFQVKTQLLNQNHWIQNDIYISRNLSQEQLRNMYKSCNCQKHCYSLEGTRLYCCPRQQKLEIISFQPKGYSCDLTDPSQLYKINEITNNIVTDILFCNYCIINSFTNEVGVNLTQDEIKKIKNYANE